MGKHPCNSWATSSRRHGCTRQRHASFFETHCIRDANSPAKNQTSSRRRHGHASQAFGVAFGPFQGHLLWLLGSFGFAERVRHYAPYVWPLAPSPVSTLTARILLRSFRRKDITLRVMCQLWRAIEEIKSHLGRRIWATCLTRSLRAELPAA